MTTTPSDVRAAAVRCLTATQRERRRLGARLHAGAAQELTAALLDLDAGPPGPGQARARDAVHRALVEVREVSQELRPLGAPDDGGPPGVGARAAAARRRGVTVDLELHVDDAALDLGDRLAVDAVLEAGLPAAGRHATVASSDEAGEVVLRVHADRARPPALAAAEDLVLLLGGALAVREHGDDVDLVLRLAQRDAAAPVA